MLRSFARKQLDKWELEDKMDVSQKDSAGRTPLHLAGLRETEAVVKRRLDEGANPNEKDNFGRTALHFTGNSKCIEILLEHGADINAKDINGRTPLHYFHYNLYTIETLLKHNAKIVVSNKGLTPLDELRQHTDALLTMLDKKEEMIALLSDQIEKHKQREQQQEAFSRGLFDKKRENVTPKTSLNNLRENEIFDINVVKEIFKFM